MRAIIYHLLKSPRQYATLKQELDSATASGQLSTPNIEYAEAIKLPFLNACIKEGMRLHPSVALTMPRIVPEGGEEFNGYYVPAGYRVGVNPAVVQYDKSVFGEDADTFNPERWLGPAAKEMEKAMVPFGAGSRTCIGKNVSIDNQ